MTKIIGEMLDSPEEFSSWAEHATVSLTVLLTVARAKLLQQWGSEPISLDELSARSEMPREQLGRLINFLVSQGVLEIRHDGSISHTPRSHTLQAFRPLQLVSRMSIEAGFYLDEAIRSGTTAFEACHGKPVFEYFAENPRQASEFGEFMSWTTVRDEPLILAHRFKPFRLAVDIGGSHGTLLSGILAGKPAARGILFDLPDVADQAAARLRTLSEGHRIEAVGGDFFKSVPAGGDLYLLKQVLHDWNDKECIAILKSVRKAIAPGGRIAIIDRLLPETLAPDPVFGFDIFMMIWTTGHERKLSEFRGLLESAGFALDHVTRNHGRVSVIEADPV